MTISFLMVLEISRGKMTFLFRGYFAKRYIKMVINFIKSLKTE